MIFTVLAVAAPVVTGLLNDAPNPNSGMWSLDKTMQVEVSPTHIRVIGGTFSWRFFEWQIFGSNDLPFGSDSDGFSVINIFNLTLFRAFLVFITIAMVVMWKSVSIEQKPTL